MMNSLSQMNIGRGQKKMFIGIRQILWPMGTNDLQHIILGPQNVCFYF